VPLTLVAGLGHASLGSVDWPLLGLLLAGSLPGIWLGSRLVHQHPRTPDPLAAVAAAGLCRLQADRLLISRLSSWTTMYQYTDFDRQFVQQRAAQFRDQLRSATRRARSSEDDFRPLRLQNGWYVQRYAPMLRVAVPYGEISTASCACWPRMAREFDQPSAELHRHHGQGQGGIALGDRAPACRPAAPTSPRATNVQFNWIPLHQKRPT
jgi:hypothetical protein